MTKIHEAQNVQQTKVPAKSAPVKNKETSAAANKKPLGATDAVETSTKNGMPKLTPILYEIKDGDSLRKIADELGLKITDLVDQLKDSGKLPKDYDPSEKHTKDISWMKKGNKIKVSYPETDKQKEDYEAYTTERTRKYYTLKAQQKKLKEEQSLAKKREEYDALPWYKKIFSDRP